MERKKILIAGRYADAAELESSILGRSEFRVFTAYTGKDAFLIHSREKVDLVVAGLDLTDYDTEELCTRIRSDKDLMNVPILIIGGHSQEEREKFDRCKANIYLEKPVSDEMFQKKISDQLKVSPRKSTRIPVSVRITGRQRSEGFHAVSENLSSTGMLLITERTLDPGDSIDCSLALSGIGMVAVQAKIVRINRSGAAEFRYGTQFTRISLQDQAYLDEFLRWENKKSGND